MSRNGSGTMSVVNTFVPFTTADANDVNENFTDIATELTNSLPRDGQAGMLGQFKSEDGTVSLPGISFTNDLNTGIRRVGADQMALVAGGADIMTVSSQGLRGVLLKGMLWGLTLSNNVADATNDIDIAVGYAASDSATPELMTLGTAITKRLDASWAVGTNQGGLDTGSIANATYHVFVIQRSDTGVVDALFSTSVTSPTLPSNYDRKRRIGSIIRSGGVITPFLQDGDRFMYQSTPSADVAAANPGTAAVTRTLGVPSGIRVKALLNVGFSAATAADAPAAIYISDLSAVDTAANANSAASFSAFTSAAGSASGSGQVDVMTNASRQVRSRLQQSAAGTTLFILTNGWEDSRGRTG